MKDALLTTSAVARMIGKSEGSVRLYERTGRLPALKTTTGRAIFRKSDVKKFAEKLAKKAESELSG